MIRSGICLGVALSCLVVNGCNPAGKKAVKQPRYYHSGDFGEQFLYLSERVSMVKHVGRDAAGELQCGYSVVAARFNGPPDLWSLSGNLIDEHFARNVVSIGVSADGKFLFGCEERMNRESMEIVKFPFCVDLEHARSVPVKDGVHLKDSKQEISHAFFDRRLVELLENGSQE